MRPDGASLGAVPPIDHLPPRHSAAHRLRDLSLWRISTSLSSSVSTHSKPTRYEKEGNDHGAKSRAQDLWDQCRNLTYFGYGTSEEHCIESELFKGRHSEVEVACEKITSWPNQRRVRRCARRRLEAWW